MFNKRIDSDDLFQESRLDKFKDMIDEVLEAGLSACERFKDEKIEPKFYNFSLRRTQIDKNIREYNRPKNLAQAKRKVMMALRSFNNQHKVENSVRESVESREFKQILSLNGQEMFIIESNAVINNQGFVVAMINNTSLFGIRNPIFAIKKPMKYKTIVEHVALEWEDVMLYGGVDDQGRLFKGMNQKNIVAKVN